MPLLLLGETTCGVCSKPIEKGVSACADAMWSDATTTDVADALAQELGHYYK